VCRLMSIESKNNAEFAVLLEGILRIHGYDFRHYAKSSLKRRVKKVMEHEKMANYTQLLERIIHDKSFFQHFLLDLSVTVTDMFRDPHFYKTFREIVIPVLKTYPYIKIWHAGCATGEEVYSMAILLYEEGFLGKSTIFATDINTLSLKIAKEGVYPSENIKKYTENYIRAGGKASFSNYYQAKYQSAKIHSFLKDRVTFAHHNLVTDGIFGEMNVILCRNVLIYFDQELQNRVLDLFHESLCYRGYLCLGTKETTQFSSAEPKFELISPQEKIYKKRQ